MSEKVFFNMGKWSADYDGSGNCTGIVFDRGGMDLLGIEPGGTKDLWDAWRGIVHPDDLETTDRTYESFMEKHPEGMDYDSECRMKVGDDYHMFHLFGHCLRREDGSVSHVDGAMFDIQDIIDGQEAVKTVSQNNARLFALEDSFESLYDVELESGRYVSYDRGAFYTKNISDKLVSGNEFFADLRENVERVIYPDDREEIYRFQTRENIKKVLSEKDHMDHYYRILSDRGPVWLRMRIVYKDSDRKNVIVGVFNAEEEMAAKEREKKAREELESTNARLFALEDNFESLYDVEMESGRYDVFVKGDFFRNNVIDKLSVPKDYFAQLRDNIDAVIYEEDRDGLVETLTRESIRNELSGSDHFDYYYRLNTENGPVWFKMRIVYKDAEKKNVIIGVFNAENDVEAKQLTEQKAQLEKSLIFTNYFLDTYVSAYYVNFKTLECQVYKRTEDLERDYPIITNYYDSLKEYIGKSVHPDDRAELYELIKPESMKKALADKAEFAHVFRDISGGREKVYRMQVIRGTEKDCAAFGFIDVTEEMTEQNKKLQENEKTRKLVESVAASYDVAYAVNIADDTYKLLKNSSAILEGGERFSGFREAIEEVLAIVHPSDRERMKQELDYGTIRENLRGRVSYDVEYRVILDGVTSWHEMNVTSIDEDSIALGFADRDSELMKLHLEEKRYDEYFALFVVDLDTGMLKTLVNNEAYKKVPVGCAAPYTETIRDFASYQDEEPRKFFMQISDIEFVKKDLMDGDKRTFSYKSSHLPGDRWIDVTSYVILRHKDGTPAMFTLGFGVVDALATIRRELRTRITQNAQMISGLASGYDSLFYVNLAEGVIKPYATDRKSAPKIEKLISGSTDVFDIMHRYVRSGLVHPDDRSLFEAMDRDYLMEKLGHQKKFSMRYRRFAGGKYHWNVMDVVKYEDADEAPNALAVGFADRDEEIRNEMEQQEKLEAALVAEISRAREEKTYQMAILNDAYSYFRIDLSKNIIIPPIVEKVDGKAVDYTDKFPSPLPSYEEVIAIGSRMYVDDEYKESYIEKQSCRYLIDCFNHGNLMPEYTCHIYSTRIGWHYRKYVTYLSRDEATGDICGMSVAYDITKEFEAAEKERLYKAELLEARNAAEEANSAKTNFLFSMSHDIRTPMNAITGFTGMAIKHIDDREKVLDCLEKTQKAGNMLLSLINGILEVSRIESGHAKLDEQVGNVYYSFSNIEQTLREMAEEKDIDLSFEFGDVRDKYVYADFSRCMRVFVNLISNGIKYTNEGGYVKVRCEQVGRAKDGVATYRYTVSDNGIGMSEEFQKHVFEQFSREETSTVSGIQGTGLGMAVTKSFVELMGGTITVESRQGVGSTFTVILPFRVQEGESYTDPETGEVISSSKAAGNMKPVDFRGRKALLVEDNEMNREIASDILSEEGITVEEADDGTTAVDMMKDKGPYYYDFILMDIQMPKMNGYDATRAIREMYPDERIPIIALSANAFAEDREASKAAGMDDHVSKPINIKDLFGVLEKFLK